MPDDNRPWEPERFLASNAVCYSCARFIVPDKQSWTWMVVGTCPEDLFLMAVHGECLKSDGWEWRLPGDRWRME